MTIALGDPCGKVVVLPVACPRPGRRGATPLSANRAGTLKVAVTAPPDKGRANEAIVEVLAEALGLKRSQIELVSGPTSRQKKFLLRGVSAAVIADRIRQVV